MSTTNSTRADPAPIVREIDSELAAEAQHYRDAASAFAARRGAPLVITAEIVLLQQQIARAAQWFEYQAQAHPIVDHTDRLFVDLTLRARTRELQSRALSLARLHREDPLVALDALWCEYQRLACLFQVSCFERKRYETLSHAPNKAMNHNRGQSCAPGRGLGLTLT